MPPGNFRILWNDESTYLQPTTSEEKKKWVVTELFLTVHQWQGCRGRGYQPFCLICPYFFSLKCLKNYLTFCFPQQIDVLICSLLTWLEFNALCKATLLSVNGYTNGIYRLYFKWNLWMYDEFIYKKTLGRVNNCSWKHCLKVLL